MNNEESKEFEFTKKLSLPATIILCIGSLLGAGIYVLIGITARIAGPSIFIAIIFDFIVALCIAGCYSECVSLNPKNGGSLVYVKEAFGNKGLFIGWIVWLSNMAYASLLAFSIGIFMMNLFNLSSYFFVFIFGTISILVFTIFNILGSKGLSAIQNPLTIALVGTLIIGVIYLLSTPPQGNFFPLFPTGYISMFVASAFLFDIFIGFEDICSIPEEIKNPKKNIPKAFFVSLIIAVIVYELVIFTLLFTISLEDITNSDVAILDAVKSNQVIYFILFLGAVFALLTSLGIALMAASRNVYALSKYDFLDRRWSKISKRFESPTNALWLSAIIAIIILLTGRVESITSISNVSYLVAVAFIGLAVIKFRRTREYDENTYKMPFYPITAYVCIILPLFLIFFLELQIIFLALAWFLIGVIIYFFFSSKRRIFGTVFLISVFFVAIYSVFLGILIVIIGIIFYLFQIADRHSVILTLAGVKFFCVLLVAFFIWAIITSSIITIAISEFKIIFQNLVLIVLIFICIFAIGTIILDIIPIREFIYFFIKKAHKEKVVINLGFGKIIDFDKKHLKTLQKVNFYISSLQIGASIFIFFIIFLLGIGFVSILRITFGTVIFTREVAEFLVLSSFIMFACALLISGILMMYINKGIVYLGV